MDIRKADPTSFILTDEGETKFLIPSEKIIDSKKMKESLIFNLVRKLELSQDMKKTYYSNIASAKSIYISSYIHSIGVPILFLCSYFMLNYKRKINIYNLTGLVCVCTILNESVKYFYIRIKDYEKTQQYDEYAANYKYLIKNYQKALTTKEIINTWIGFSFDYNGLIAKIKTHQNERFYEELILSKII